MGCARRRGRGGTRQQAKEAAPSTRLREFTPWDPERLFPHAIMVAPCARARRCARWCAPPRCARATATRAPPHCGARKNEIPTGVVFPQVCYSYMRSWSQRARARDGARCATVRDGARCVRHPTVVLGKQPLSGGGAAEVARLGAAGPFCRDTANRDGPQPTTHTPLKVPYPTYTDHAVWPRVPPPPRK